MKECKQCQSAFKITEEDRAFYNKVSPVFNGQKYLIPEPKSCPDCRNRLRQAWLNQNNLYYRTCDFSGEKIISLHSPKADLKVYKNQIWWSDQWNPIDYGRDFDFSRPFFEQFKELLSDVPLMALVVSDNLNSDYVNYSLNDKNCYLCFCADYDEDCSYLQHVYHSKNTLDCLYCYNMELCYECVDCKDSYLLFYSQNSSNCSNSWYLLDCNNSKNCFASASLRNREYYFFNEALSPQEYQKKIETFKKMSYSERIAFELKIKEHLSKYPKRAYIGMNNENVSGDYLFNSKNSFNSFDSVNLEDSKYCSNIKGAKDFYDVTHFGNNSELCYQVAGTGANSQRVLFSSLIWLNCSEILYSMQCVSGSKNLFGCVGMKKAQYCILNKQYSREEYEQLIPKIIEHMKKTGEWGAFFPTHLSPFGYNETIAQEYYPLKKEESLAKGFKWSDYQNPMPEAQKVIPANNLPGHISEIPDDVLNWAIVCERSKKPFKLTKQELAFYRAHDLNIPRLHPEERHKKRMALRNPRKLLNRECDQCHKSIQSSYPPESNDKIYCEECYLANVY